jgi:hypothetical protein
VLAGMETASSTSKKDQTVLLGANALLVSSFQTLNNARIILASGILFSDELFKKTIIMDGKK